MGLFDRFINAARRPDSLTFPIANAANPVQWGKLGAAITGSFVAAVATGFAQIPAAVGDAWVSLLEGPTTFITGTGTYVSEEIAAGIPGLEAGTAGLLDVTFGAVERSIAGLWTFNVDQFGILAGPATVGITLAALFVVTKGATTAVDILTGGD